MAELTYKQRRRCLDYADRVASIALDAPDRGTKRELYAVVNSIRKRYGYTDEQKRQEVWLRILDGASTIADIIAETNFHKDDVHAITKEFEIEKRVVFRQIRSGERGRPMICIFPIGLKK
jgi:hypothetical protein